MDMNSFLTPSSLPLNIMQYHTDSITNEVEETDDEEVVERDLSVKTMSEEAKLSALEQLKYSAKKLFTISPKVIFSSECQTDESSLSLNHKGKPILKCFYCCKSYVQERAFKKHEERCNKR